MYVDSILIPGETVVHSGRLSLWGQFWTIFFGLVLLSAFGLGLILWLLAWVRYRSTELAITNRRVIAKFGFISRRTIEINLDKIESVQVDQSIMGRMLDYGTLLLRGTGSTFEPIVGIAAPLEFRKAFVAAVDEVQRR